MKIVSFLYYEDEQEREFAEVEDLLNYEFAEVRISLIADLLKCSFAKTQLRKHIQFLKSVYQPPGNGTFSLGHFHPLTDPS